MSHTQFSGRKLQLILKGEWVNLMSGFLDRKEKCMYLIRLQTGHLIILLYLWVLTQYIT